MRPLRSRKHPIPDVVKDGKIDCNAEGWHSLIDDKIVFISRDSSLYVNPAGLPGASDDFLNAYYMRETWRWLDGHWELVESEHNYKDELIPGRYVQPMSCPGDCMFIFRCQIQYPSVSYRIVKGKVLKVRRLTTNVASAWCASEQNEEVVDMAAHIVSKYDLKHDGWMQADECEDWALILYRPSYLPRPGSKLPSRFYPLRSVYVYDGKRWKTFEDHVDWTQLQNDREKIQPKPQKLIAVFHKVDKACSTVTIDTQQNTFFDFDALDRHCLLYTSDAADE